jgi:hypothetical protein
MRKASMARHATPHGRGWLSLHVHRRNPYGDGHAAERIVERIHHYFAGRAVGALPSIAQGENQTRLKWANAQVVVPRRPEFRWKSRKSDDLSILGVQLGIE